MPIDQEQECPIGAPLEPHWSPIGAPLAFDAVFVCEKSNGLSMVTFHDRHPWIGFRVFAGGTWLERHLFKLIRQFTDLRRTAAAYQEAFRLHRSWPFLINVNCIFR